MLGKWSVDSVENNLQSAEYPRGVIGFPVRDYCLSLFYGAVRYRRYRCVTVFRGYKHLHGAPITATGRVEVIKIRLRSYRIRRRR